MFDKNPRKGKDGKADADPTKGNLYYVSTRNPRTDRLEVNTLPKKDFYPIQINEVGTQHDTVHYTKPHLLDAPVNKQTRHDFEMPPEENHDVFAEDERMMGATPPTKMSIDTSDHMPIAINLMLWPSNIITGSEMRLTSSSRQVSFERATPVGQPQLWWYPKVMVTKGYVWISWP